MLRCEFRHDDFDWLKYGRMWDSGLSVWYSPTGLTTLWNGIFLAVYRVAHLQPALYYAAIIVGHALATSGVLWAAYELTQDRLVALLTALFFGLFWQHHEVITWIAVGYRPVAMLCIMACIASYARSRRLASRRWLFLSTLAAVGALLSKEDAVSLFIAMPLVSLVVPREPQQNIKSVVTLEYLILAAVFLIYVALQVMTGNRQGAVEVGEQKMYAVGPHMASNLIFCVPQMLVPDLSFVTYQEFLGRLGASSAMREFLQRASIVACGLLSLSALVFVWKGSARIRFCILWCYIMYLPFMPFTPDLARAPRYLYTGTFGLALLFGLGAAHWLHKSHAHTQKKAIWSVIGIFFLANVAFLLLIQKNRVRDSRVRQAITMQTLRVVVRPQPDSRVIMLGIPDHLIDLTQGISLRLDVPVEAGASPTILSKRDAYIVRVGNAPDYEAQLVQVPR
jgi:hypothetical protein